MIDARNSKDEYEAPALVELGSLEELTQGGGVLGTDFRGPGS
jgi:hypothetical protein